MLLLTPCPTAGNTEATRRTLQPASPWPWRLLAVYPQKLEILEKLENLEISQRWLSQPLSWWDKSHHCPALKQGQASGHLLRHGNLQPQLGLFYRDKPQRHHPRDGSCRKPPRSAPTTAPCIISSCRRPRVHPQLSPEEPSLGPAPLTAVGKLEGEDAALVEVQLVLVGFCVVQHFHVAALHSHREPLARRAVSQREDLWRGTEGCSGRGFAPTSSACSPLPKQAPATSVSPAIPHRRAMPIAWAQAELGVIPLVILVT